MINDNDYNTNCQTELIQVVCNMADKEGCVGFSCEHYKSHIPNNRPGVICTEESRCPEIGRLMAKCIEYEQEEREKREELTKFNKRDDEQYAILKLPRGQYITIGNGCKCNLLKGQNFNEMYCDICGHKYSFTIDVRTVINFE